MERILLLTSDGSHTVSIPSLDITYHSLHGAVGESVHVFINAGLKKKWELYGESSPINILEVGFGTGLNALLTCLESVRANRQVFYTAIEPFPLDDDLLLKLNYAQVINNEGSNPGGKVVVNDDIFRQIHAAPFNRRIDVNNVFSILKVDTTLSGFVNNDTYDLVYFDAFAPTADAELWSVESMEKLFSMLKPGAILTTYCSKSVVRKNMQAAGFRVEKIPGPWGKREMVRAYKPGAR
jgi:tRNA U34 5-methylaminomethyl-2-thiouridine-forming methyltransferase MnmC